MFFVMAGLPLLYSLLVGTAYSMFFKKKFIDSIAPAFFIQILAMLITGVVFAKLSIGIWIVVVISFMTILFLCVKNKSASGLIEVFINSDHRFEVGIIVFFLLYCFIFVSNTGKKYFMWDEFSHWGWFVRENFQNDRLYCTSTKPFFHKDYVPGVAIFETLWVRLSIRYSEATVYRGIQMLQAAMMMPAALGADGILATKERGKKTVFVLVNLFIIFFMPLFSSLPFYHTIYQDLILGVFVYYCFWIILTNKAGIYSFFLLAISLSNLLLCKNTAVAFLPILLLFAVVFWIKYDCGINSKVRILVGTICAGAISIIPWKVYTYFISSDKVGISGGQSYSSLSGESIIGVFLHDGSITYQNDVENAYINALFQKGIVGNLSYVCVILICVVALLMLMLLTDKTVVRSKIRLIALWLFLAGVYYAFLMYFMYLLLFAESEAVSLASFNRYMSTFVLTALLITVATVLLYCSHRCYYLSYLIAIILAENILLFFGAFQMLPGIFTNDQVQFEGHIDYLNKSVPDGSKLMFVCDLEDMGAIGRIDYYCEDISFGGGIYGPKQYDEDVWSKDYSVEEFVDECSKYDYIYFFSYGDKFEDTYDDAFEYDDVIDVGKLYRIEIVNGRVRTFNIEE